MKKSLTGTICLLGPFMVLVYWRNSSSMLSCLEFLFPSVSMKEELPASISILVTVGALAGGAGLFRGERLGESMVMMLGFWACSTCNMGLVLPTLLLILNRVLNWEILNAELNIQ